MKTEKLLSTGRFIAVCIFILGIIHIVATFTPLIQDGLECLSERNLSAVIYFSLICGLFLIICGLLLFVLFGKLFQILYLFLPVFIITVFAIACGILSVVFMADNPFAWIVLILTSTELILVSLLKNK